MSCVHLKGSKLASIFGFSGCGGCGHRNKFGAQLLDSFITGQPGLRYRLIKLIIWFAPLQIWGKYFVLTSETIPLFKTSSSMYESKNAEIWNFPGAYAF